MANKWTSLAAAPVDDDVPALRRPRSLRRAPALQYLLVPVGRIRLQRLVAFFLFALYLHRFSRGVVFFACVVFVFVVVVVVVFILL